MAGLSFDVLRTGKKYRLTNFGERHDFVIEHILGNGDFKVKDLNTSSVITSLNSSATGKAMTFYWKTFINTKKQYTIDQAEISITLFGFMPNKNLITLKGLINTI